MLKKIGNAILSLILMIASLFISGCNNTTTNNNTSNINNIIRYDLVEYYYDYEQVNVSETFDYYYVEFNLDNKEYKLDWCKINTNTPTITYGTFVETENQYIVSVNGLSMSYIKKDIETIECRVFTDLFILKKAK